MLYGLTCKAVSRLLPESSAEHAVLYIRCRHNPRRLVAMRIVKEEFAKSLPVEWRLLPSRRDSACVRRAIDCRSRGRPSRGASSVDRSGEDLARREPVVLRGTTGIQRLVGTRSKRKSIRHGACIRRFDLTRAASVRRGSQQAEGARNEMTMRIARSLVLSFHTCRR